MTISNRLMPARKRSETGRAGCPMRCLHSSTATTKNTARTAANAASGKNHTAATTRGIRTAAVSSRRRSISLQFPGEKKRWGSQSLAFFFHTAVPALSATIPLYGLPQHAVVEIRPQDIRKIELGIGQIPEEEIADAPL